MKIAIGNDHAAPELKLTVIEHLKSKGIEALDMLWARDVIILTRQRQFAKRLQMANVLLEYLFAEQESECQWLQTRLRGFVQPAVQTSSLQGSQGNTTTQTFFVSVQELLVKARHLT